MLMTEEEAYEAHEACEEAWRRWGPNGMCWDQKEHMGPNQPRYCVGVVANLLSGCAEIHIHGKGATWAEAFADADVQCEWVHAGMTADEARREAYDRWSFRGVCHDRGDAHHPMVGHYMVGVGNPRSGGVTVHGEGPTWEDAFKEADGRAEFLAEMDAPHKDAAVVIRLDNIKVSKAVVDETTADTERVLAANRAKQGCPCGCGASCIEECWEGSIAASCCVCNSYPCFQMIGQDPWCVRCAER